MFGIATDCRGVRKREKEKDREREQIENDMNSRRHGFEGREREREVKEWLKK
jgi:hypothetical protein